MVPICVEADILLADGICTVIIAFWRRMFHLRSSLALELEMPVE